MQDILAFRDDAKQRDAENLKNVFDAEHLAALCTILVVAGQQQVLLHWLAAFRFVRGRVEQADNAIGIADRRHLRIGDHHGEVGVPHGERRSPLDAGRAVADDPIERRPQLADHALDAVIRERVLVARLRGGEQEERVNSLVANERLRKPTSKSTTTTRSPARAKAAPRAAVDVVLPTPPFPDVTTTTWAI